MMVDCVAMGRGRIVDGDTRGEERKGLRSRLLRMLPWLGVEPNDRSNENGSTIPGVNGGEAGWLLICSSSPGGERSVLRGGMGGAVSGLRSLGM